MYVQEIYLKEKQKLQTQNHASSVWAGVYDQSGCSLASTENLVETVAPGGENTQVLLF